MAYGTVPLRKIQLGQQQAPGSAVVASAIWRGPGAQIDGGETVVRPEENVGLIVDTDRAYIPYRIATLDFPECPATFEQLGYVLAAGVQLDVDGAADGDGDGHIYEFDVDQTAPNTFQTFTIEAGDNNAAAAMNYAFPTEFTLTWAPKEALKLTSKWVGRQKIGQSFTVLALSVSDPVEEILAPKIYVDDVDDLGDTQLEGTLIGYELNWQTGLVPQATGDGENYFHVQIPKKPSFTLRLTYEHDANCSAEYAKFLALISRVIRILHEGSTIDNGNTGTYTKKTLEINLCGKYTAFPPFSDQNGDNIVTVEFQGGYNATANFFGYFILVNTLAALV